MAISSSIAIVAAVMCGQPPMDFQHDFRGGHPLPAVLKRIGPNAEDVVKYEVEGLRIKVPAHGKQTKGWGVTGTFALAGDFEITATYDILNAEPPLTGHGVGVAISVAPSAERMKFAKVGRFLRLNEGSVFLTEAWSKVPPTYYDVQRAPTLARSGQLRLERKGALLRCLASEAPGGDFQAIAERAFGAEAMGEVYFIANNNGSPSALDVRLLDLTIHATGIIPAHAAAQPAPDIVNLPPQADGSTGTLAKALLVGLALTVVAGAVLTGWLYWRRHADVVPANVVPCSRCGTSLKFKTSHAGKKVKCPRCGQGTLLPAHSEEVS